MNLKNTLILFSTIICNINFVYSTKYSFSCETKPLFRVSFKPICESDDFIVSCYGPSNLVKKATIQCNSGYYSARKVKEQIITCKENGEWSEEPMECLPECISEPIKSTNVQNELRFPTAYVEFVRKDPIEGRANVFPAHIIDENHVAVLNESFVVGNVRYFAKSYYTEGFKEEIVLDLKEDFEIRIYKDSSKKNFKSFAIEYVLWLDDDNILSVAGMYPKDPNHEFIKFDEKTKPLCESVHKAYNIHAFEKFILLPIYYDRPKCQSLNSDSTKVEKRCYSTHFYDWYKKEECSEHSDVIANRCQFGYRNKNIDVQNDNLLNSCFQDKWRIYGDIKDCEYICGKLERRTTFTPLLFKANKTQIVSSPWHVGIFANHTSPNGDFLQICGGTIVHSNIVISAAHCFYDASYGRIYNESNYIVGAGKQFRSFEVSEPLARFSRVKKIHIPEYYLASLQTNDIAVVALDRHFDFSSPYIKPACLQWETHLHINTQEFNYESSEGHVVGWGATSRDDPSSSELMRINLTIISNEACKKGIDIDLKSSITDDKFCAKNDMQSAPCQGDSGGGFIIEKYTSSGPRYFLEGIVSIGVDIRNYCSDHFIALFTKIRPYRNYIRQVIFEEREGNVKVVSNNLAVAIDIEFS